jgi:hypothetical protein
VNDTNCQHSSYRDVTDILKSSRGTIKLIVLHSSSRRDSSSTISSKHSRDVQPGAETEIEIIKGEKRQYLNMPFDPEINEENGVINPDLKAQVDLVYRSPAVLKPFLAAW